MSRAARRHLELFENVLDDLIRLRLGPTGVRPAKPSLVVSHSATITRLPAPRKTP